MMAVGYRKKPLLTHGLALALMVAPLANLAFVARAPVEEVVPFSTWTLLALIFGSGVSLLLFRRWAWHFALTTLACLVVYDLVQRLATTSGKGLAFTGVMAATLAIAAFVSSNAFR